MCFIEASRLILGPLDEPPMPLGVYFTCLENASSADVRITAFGVTISYIQCAFDEKDLDLEALSMTLRLEIVMMQVLIEGLNGGQEVMMQVLIEGL
ncbi:hypothetical protein Tco_0358449 [Tanacetum coccineum]